MGREEVAIDRSEDVFCCGKQGGIEQLGLNLMEDLSVLGNHRRRRWWIAEVYIRTATGMTRTDRW